MSCFKKRAIASGSAFLNGILVTATMILTTGTVSGQRSSRNFYISETGNDSNQGNRQSPLRSFQGLENFVLQGGDSILLRGGDTFEGTLQLTVVNPGKTKHIVVGSYGKGRAMINGGNGPAITIKGSRRINVANLILTGSGRKGGNTTNGLDIIDCREIVVDNVALSGFQKAGISIYRSKDIDVSHCIATNNGFAGISIGGAGSKLDSRNIRLRHCRAENNPGDPTNFSNHSGNGIVSGYCTNVLIEYCVASNNGWDMPRKGNGPVGIWTYESDSVIIQHCLSFRNRTSPGASDGGGFDLDGGVTNSVIQYCLSYENEGSGYGLFQYSGASNWYNNTIRFNISEDDGAVTAGCGGILVWNSSYDTLQLRDCYLYNNTIVSRKAPAISYATESDHSGFLFINNILLGKDSILRGRYKGSEFAGNYWYSLEFGLPVNGVRNIFDWSEHKAIKSYDRTSSGSKNANFQKTSALSPKSWTEVKNYVRNFMLPPSSPILKSGVELPKNGNFPAKTSFTGKTVSLRGVGAIF